MNGRRIGKELGFSLHKRGFSCTRCHVGPGMFKQKTSVRLSQLVKGIRDSLEWNPAKSFHFFKDIISNILVGHKMFLVIWLMLAFLLHLQISSSSWTLCSGQWVQGSTLSTSCTLLCPSVECHLPRCAGDKLPCVAEDQLRIDPPHLFLSLECESLA